jgi:hypothetical protein
MLKIEIRETTVAERNQQYIDKQGKPKSALFREQMGWAFVTLPSGSVAPYPEKMSISLEADQPPYAVGLYVLAPESLYIGRFNKLQVGRLRLKALAKDGVRSVA